jgi:hypothetical protein
MPEHLEEAGGEFLQAVTFDFGDGRLFYPRFVTVNSAGNITWYSAGTALPEGTHELYIFDAQGWGNFTNINELSAGDVCYGKITVTTGASFDECNLYLDLATLAHGVLRRH